MTRSRIPYNSSEIMYLGVMFKITKKTGEEKVKWGWAMYDWANNVYSLVITTAIFPLYFTALTSSKDENGNVIDTVIFFGNEFTNSQLYSYVLGASFLTVIMLSPILSGIADFTGKKKLFMRVFTYAGAAGCIGLFWFHPEHLEWSLFPFYIASVGFWGSVGFYNAFLPEIAPREEHDSLSAKGFAMGYWSSIIILVICAGIIMIGGSQYTPVSFLLVGVWWFGFSHITFNALPNGKAKKRRNENLIFQGFRELRGVARELKGKTHLTRYLTSFFFMSMGIQTIMQMASIFGQKEIGLTSNELIVTILVVNLLAIPGAFGVSALSKRIGNIRALTVCIVGWTALCIYAYLLPESKIGFYGAAGMIGFLMGGTQSLNRASYAKLIPDTDDPASYFSFYEVLEKGGLTIGMFGWGYIDGFTGSMRGSILAMTFIFLIAMVAMLSIPKEYRHKTQY